MGLDMYLTRRTYVKNWDHMNEKERHQITVLLNNKKHPFIQPEKISNIIEEVGYWRKANMIHGWFVDKVQKGEDDCGEYRVEEEHFRELLSLCEETMKLKDLTPEEIEQKAQELLPTSQGFFFGSYDYDEYYFDDIQRTIDIIKPIIELYDTRAEISKLNKDATRESYIYQPYPEYYYQSSW